MEPMNIPDQILRQAEAAGVPAALLERAAEAENPAALAALARDLGGALSPEEANAMFSTLQAAKAAQGESGELTDDALERVTGGGDGWYEFLLWLKKLIEMIARAFQ